MDAQTRNEFICDWCNIPIICSRCPAGAYHMHSKCLQLATDLGYFAKVPKSQHQIPVHCTYNAVHFVIGNINNT